MTLRRTMGAMLALVAAAALALLLVGGVAAWRGGAAEAELERLAVLDRDIRAFSGGTRAVLLEGADAAVLAALRLQGDSLGRRLETLGADHAEALNGARAIRLMLALLPPAPEGAAPGAEVAPVPPARLPETLSTLATHAARLDRAVEQATASARAALLGARLASLGLIVAVALGAVAAAAGGWVWVHRRVVRPLRRLTRSVEASAAGAAHGPPADLPRDEIRLLWRIFAHALERREASEAELREALERETDLRRRLSRAQDLARMGAWEVDLRTGALSWSQGVHDIVETSPDDFEGTEEAFLRLVHPEDRPALVERRRAWLEEGGAFEMEHRIVTPAGRVKWVIERAETETDETGEVVRTSGTVQDVTSLREAELARSAAESEAERNAALLRIAGDVARFGGWRWRVGDDHVEWSDATARIHDRPPGHNPTLDEAIGHYEPSDRPRIEAAFRRCLETGEPFDGVFRLRTAAGRRIRVRSVGQAVHGPDGAVIGAEGAFQDVTETLDALEAAERRDRELREVVASLKEGFFVVDAERRFRFVNAVGAEMIGRDPDALIGRHVGEAFPEVMETSFSATCEDALRTGESRSCVDWFPPLARWFEARALPTPLGLAVHLRDVTDERARDERLELLEAAVARQNDILLITEAEPLDAPDGPRIVYVNEAFEARTGYAPEEVIGRTPRILQGPRTDRRELDRIGEALRRWEPVRAELVNYRKDGEPFWLELDIAPIVDRDGRRTHWVAVEREITERKAVEEALRLGEERFRLVARAASDVIWDWNVQTDAIWWSANAGEVFRDGHGAEAPGAAALLDRIHPEDRGRVADGLRRALASNGDAWRDEHRILRADGSVADVLNRAFVIRDDAGRALRVVGSLSDVTERRALEAQLRHVQKMEAIGRLTGGVAHDFNNLLTVILSNGEELAAGLADRPRLRAMADLTVTAAERGAELTGRLLAFSRQQPLDPRRLDLNALVRQADPLFRRTLPESIELEVLQSPGLRPVLVDPGQLEVALLNLVINARDAMPDGGRLAIETADAWLDEDYAARHEEVEPGPYAVISVSDTGVGMDRETLARAFEPFFTTKDVGQGSGLGLSMVFGFAKQSGGHVKIYSEPGRGTTVRLYLRRAAEDAAPDADETPAPEATGGDEHVLVAEDDALVREHVAELLRGLGYAVTTAADGREALERLEGLDDVALLLTDVVMPGDLDGRDLAERATALRPDLKVLFTSGYTENAITHHGRLDPGVKLLSKPYRRQDLAAKVRDALDA